MIKMYEFSGERPNRIKFFVDTKGWTVERFEESKAGFLEMKERIKGLGFVLSEEEEQEWNEFISYYES